MPGLTPPSPPQSEAGDISFFQRGKLRERMKTVSSKVANVDQ